MACCNLAIARDLTVFLFRLSFFFWFLLQLVFLSRITDGNRLKNAFSQYTIQIQEAHKVSLPLNALTVTVPVTWTHSTGFNSVNLIQLQYTDLFLVWILFILSSAVFCLLFVNNCFLLYFQVCDRLLWSDSMKVPIW